MSEINSKKTLKRLRKFANRPATKINKKSNVKKSVKLNFNKKIIYKIKGIKLKDDEIIHRICKIVPSRNKKKEKALQILQIKDFFGKDPRKFLQKINYFGRFY